MAGMQNHQQRRAMWTTLGQSSEPLISVVVGDTNWYRSTQLDVWSEITRPFADGTTAAGYIPAHDRFVVASYAVDKSVYSDDGGATWANAPTGMVVNSFFYVAANGNLIAFGNNAFRLSANGISWSAAFALPAGAWYDCTVDPANGDLFAIASNGACIKSVDDGLTWTSVTTVGGAGTAIGICHAGGDVLLVTRRGGGVWRSADRGVSWTNTAVGLNLNKVDRNPTTGAVLVTPQSGDGLRSMNGGLTFPTVIPELSGPWPMLEYVGVAKAFFAGAYGALPYYSLNDGDDWQPINMPGATPLIYAMAWKITE